MINVENVREVYEFVRDNPEKLYQSKWTVGQIQDFEEGKPEKHNPIECNTVACMAGWRSVFSAPKGTNFREDSLTLPDMSNYSYENYGAMEFGFDDHAAELVFYQANNLSDVRLILLMLFEEEGIGVPWWLSSELNEDLHGMPTWSAGRDCDCNICY